MMSKYDALALAHETVRSIKNAETLEGAALRYARLSGMLYVMQQMDLITLDQQDFLIASGVDAFQDNAKGKGLKGSELPLQWFKSK